MFKIKKKTKEILGKILYWIFFLFVVYIIYELIRKILGGSLIFESLVIALLVANLGYTFHSVKAMNKIDSKISGHLGWHKGKDSKK